MEINHAIVIYDIHVCDISLVDVEKESICHTFSTCYLPSSRCATLDVSHFLPILLKFFPIPTLLTNISLICFLWGTCISFFSWQRAISILHRPVKHGHALLRIAEGCNIFLDVIIQSVLLKLNTGSCPFSLFCFISR